ncbi:MAG: hypothetical protein LBQ33_01925 [Oscillospiraceae bacterium]|nr:hypothetical protein [Oscillospiraceae bacterium]
MDWGEKFLESKHNKAEHNPEIQFEFSIVTVSHDEKTVILNTKKIQNDASASKELQALKMIGAAPLPYPGLF